MLTVTDAATDLQLLSTVELRVAAGLDPADATHDAVLAAVGLSVSASIAAACGVARAGYAASYLTDSPPRQGEAPRTWWVEGLSEVVNVRHQCGPIYLARRPVVAVTSVTEAGSLLAPTDYELDVPQGAIYRVTGSETATWNGRIQVAYSAGYDPIPADLKGYASRLTSLYYTTVGLDPNVRSYEIPGVISVQRWVDTEADFVFPEDIMAGLERDGYRKPVLW